jgi:hypothetical protein
VRQGVQHFRDKYGVSLLPAAEDIDILTTNPDGGGEKVPEEIRRALALVRDAQFNDLLVVLALLNEPEEGQLA